MTAPTQFAPSAQEVHGPQRAHELATAMERSVHGSGAQADALLRQGIQDAYAHHPGSPAAAQAEVHRMVDTANREVAAHGFPNVQVHRGTDARGYEQHYIDRSYQGHTERWDGRQNTWNTWNVQLNVWQASPQVYGDWGATPPYVPGGPQPGWGADYPTAPWGGQAYNPQQWCQEARNLASLELSANRGNQSAMIYLNQELARDAAMLGPQGMSQLMAEVSRDYQEMSYRARYQYGAGGPYGYEGAYGPRIYPGSLQLTAGYGQFGPQFGPRYFDPNCFGRPRYFMPQVGYGPAFSFGYSNHRGGWSHGGSSFNFGIMI